MESKFLSLTNMHEFQLLMTGIELNQLLRVQVKGLPPVMQQILIAIEKAWDDALPVDD